VVHARRRRGEPSITEETDAEQAIAVPQRLVVGLVRTVHGLRGAVRVEVLTDEPELRFRPGAVLHPEGSARPLTVTNAGPDDPGWLVRFAEMADRNAAEQLRGQYLEADVAAEERAEPDTYYWHEIVGATVLDPAGRLLGTVVDVYRAGGAEVYLVRGEPYGEFDVPAVRPIVVSFEPRTTGIVIDPDALGLEEGKPRSAKARSAEPQSAKARSPKPRSPKPPSVRRHVEAP
jgi:16S rRNA processing protein RimM